MLAVIPIFCRQGEMAFWLTAKGAELLAQSLNMVSQSGLFQETIVVTASRRIAELAQGDSRTVLLTPGAPGRETDRPLPPGTRASLVALSGAVAEKSPVAVIGFRNLLLTPRILAKALDRFRSGGGHPVLSVVAPRNHPCQFFEPCRIIEAGVVSCLPDPTKMQEAIAGLNGPALLAGNFHDQGFRAAGVALDGCGGVSLPLLLRRDDTGDLCLAFDAETVSTRPTGLIIMPFSRSTGAPLKTLDIRVDSLSVPPPFRLQEDVGSFAYLLLRVVSEGGFDLPRPFPHTGGLWRIEYPASAKVNVRTGKTILGRQDFPEVFRIDGSFVLLGKHDWPDPDYGRLCREGLLQHLLESESDWVENVVDAIRVEVKRRFAGSC